MWIRTQKQDEMLEVKWIKSVPVDENDVNFVAKLTQDRDPVILGTYHKDQARRVMEDLWAMVKLPRQFAESKETWFSMPKRWEDEEDFEVDFEDVKKRLVNASKFMRDFAEAAAKVNAEKGEQE